MLSDMLDEHRGAFEYDWRDRFKMSARKIGGGKMSWGEAWRLTLLLLNDPSSQVCAASVGWSHPISREDVTLRDLFDLEHQSKVEKKVKRYPRPWPDRVKSRNTPGADVTQEQIVAAMRFAGHTARLPGHGDATPRRLRDGRGRFMAKA